VLGPDTVLDPANVKITAHDRSYPGASATTLFGVRASQATPALLLRIGGVDGVPSPSGGALTVVGPLGLTSSVAEWTGFDVSGTTGIAYFSYRVDPTGELALFTLDLTTGAATVVGPIANDLSLKRRRSRSGHGGPRGLTRRGAGSRRSPGGRRCLDYASPLVTRGGEVWRRGQGRASRELPWVERR
jgi:hypothetical protein